MNKGYNWEPTYMYFCKNLYCITIIPCRNSLGNRDYPTHEIHRYQVKKALKEGRELGMIYNQRPQV